MTLVDKRVADVNRCRASLILVVDQRREYASSTAFSYNAFGLADLACFISS